MTGQAKACPTFDAERYDELWTHTAVGAAQRRQVWRYADGLFHPGQRLLDVGCGTGADAAHFAARGVDMHATDCSPAMVDVASRRGGFAATVLRAEDVAAAGEVFDGAISNFGALNCVDDLPAVARGLGRVVRPGGYLAICTIGRFCAWETLFPGKATRRWRGSAGSSLGITVRYPTVRQILRAFSPEFELVRWVGIGLFVPPSYVRLPAAQVRIFEVFDRLLARLPLLRGMADHRLVILVRK